jgi:hypothetical protein
MFTLQSGKGRAMFAALQAALGILLCTFVPASTSFACGGIFDAKCNLEHGGMSPGNIAKQGQKAIQDVGNLFNELQASTATGPALEQAINGSHDTAMNGAMPIPPNIRQKLTGYASEDSMNRVRYKVGDNGILNIARILEQGGFADAVTLKDVIVFRGPTEAANLATWAHELKHVDQYASWGVHSFAVQYARNYRSVEDPAYAQGNGYWVWANAHGLSADMQTPAPGMATFNLTNKSADASIMVKFFSQNRGWVWPGPGTHFDLSDRLQHQYSLSCQSGETICYGGSPPGENTGSWGVGFQGDKGCSKCCMDCGGTHSWDLTP